LGNGSHHQGVLYLARCSQVRELLGALRSYLKSAPASAQIYTSPRFDLRVFARCGTR
jgi:hypothetical protein